MEYVILPVFAVAVGVWYGNAHAVKEYCFAPDVRDHCIVLTIGYLMHSFLNGFSLWFAAVLFMVYGLFLATAVATKRRSLQPRIRSFAYDAAKGMVTLGFGWGLNVPRRVPASGYIEFTSGRDIFIFSDRGVEYVGKLAGR